MGKRIPITPRDEQNCSIDMFGNALSSYLKLKTKIFMPYFTKKKNEGFVGYVRICWIASSAPSGLCQVIFLISLLLTCHL